MKEFKVGDLVKFKYESGPRTGIAHEGAFGKVVMMGTKRAALSDNDVVEVQWTTPYLKKDLEVDISKPLKVGDRIRAKLESIHSHGSGVVVEAGPEEEVVVEWDESLPMFKYELEFAETPLQRMKRLHSG